MKKLLPILFIGLLILSSCGVKDAEKVADSFHSKMKNKEYNEIVTSMISEAGLNETPKEHWVQHFKNMETVYGNIKSIDKLSGFNTNTTNSVTLVTLKYKYNFDSGKSLYEQLMLEDKGDGFKIRGLQTNEDENKLSKID